MLWTPQTGKTCPISTVYPLMPKTAPKHHTGLLQIFRFKLFGENTAIGSIFFAAVKNVCKKISYT